VQCCLPSIVDCPLPICVVVRFACAQGKQSAYAMGLIFEDWLQRSFCPVWHSPLGIQDDYFDVATALQDGVIWLADTTTGQPALQTKKQQSTHMKPAMRTRLIIRLTGTLRPSSRPTVFGWGRLQPIKRGLAPGCCLLHA